SGIAWLVNLLIESQTSNLQRRIPSDLSRGRSSHRSPKQSRHAEGAWRLVANLSRSQYGQLRAANDWTTSSLISIDPSRCARRNNLDRDVHRLDGTLVAHQMYVAAAYISEALACVVDGWRAVRTVRLVHCKLSSYDCDKARTRMRVPPSVSPHWERVLGDIEVRIASYSCVEKAIRQVASTHQVQRDGREVSGVRGVYRLSRVYKVVGDNSAVGRCQGWRGRQRDERRCDEEWEDSDLFELSQWIHCLFLSFGFEVCLSLRENAKERSK